MCSNAMVHHMNELKRSQVQIYSSAAWWRGARSLTRKRSQSEVTPNLSLRFRFQRARHSTLPGSIFLSLQLVIYADARTHLRVFVDYSMDLFLQQLASAHQEARTSLIWMIIFSN